MAASVAVVVPTRNRGELLVQAVQSIVAANPAPDEIVIADGGSTDGSVERAALLDMRIRVVERQLDLQRAQLALTKQR